MSKFYELELNIQGHKQLTDCITEFLKVQTCWFLSPAFLSKVFQFLSSVNSFWGWYWTEEGSSNSSINGMNAKGNAFLWTQKIRTESRTQESGSKEWLWAGVFNMRMNSFKKHLEVAYLVKMLSQESWEKVPKAWQEVPACFVMDSTGRMAAFCVFYIGAHLHSNRRHSLL